MKQCRGQMSMFSAEASLDPASRSALPGSEEAKRMTVTSGLKCLELYQNSDLLGLLVRMLLGSSIWRSTRYTLTWKTKVTPCKRLLFRLVPLTRRTGGTDAPLWPTPTTGAGLCGGTGNFQQLKNLEARGQITEEERRSMAAGNGGQLNPDWVEWMMGFPLGWTEE